MSHRFGAPIPKFVQGRLIIEKANQPLVMGVGFGLAVAQQETYVVLEFVKINRLFDENSAAHDKQIIEQGRRQKLGRILTGPPERICPRARSEVEQCESRYKARTLPSLLLCQTLNVQY